MPAVDLLRSAHRRAKVGAACFVAAILLFFFSPAVLVAQPLMSKTAAALAVAGLGCFIAAMLKWFAYRKELPVEKHPHQMHRLAFWTGALVMLLLSGYAIWLPISALIEGQATIIGRGSGKFSRDLDPINFWVSVAFHSALGLFLLGATAYVLWKRCQSTDSQPLLPK